MTLDTCPTCKDQAELIIGTKPRQYSAQCVVCKCRLPWCPTENGAVMCWNALCRPEPNPTVAPRKAPDFEQLRPLLLDKLKAIDKAPYHAGNAIRKLRFEHDIRIDEMAKAFGLPLVVWKTIERTFTLSEYRREQLGIIPKT